MKSLEEIRKGEELFDSEDLMEGFFDAWQDEYPDKYTMEHPDGYHEGAKHAFDSMREVYRGVAKHFCDMYGSGSSVLLQDARGRLRIVQEDAMFFGTSINQSCKREIYLTDNDIYIIDTYIKSCGGWPVLDYQDYFMVRVIPSCWHKRCPSKELRKFLESGKWTVQGAARMYDDLGCNVVSRISFTAKKGFYNVFNI